MLSRTAASWLLLLVLSLLAATAGDYALFLYRQSQGVVISFATVKQYQVVSGVNGSFHDEYVGMVDVPCVEALLPHNGRSACWWVLVHQDRWF